MKSKNILYFLILVLLSACLSDTDIVTRHDIDLTQLVKLNKNLFESLDGHKINKTVTIDGQQENHVITVDSVFIKREFSKFIDLDIKKVLLNGGYQKLSFDQETTYMRQEETTNGPVTLGIRKNANGKIISQHLSYQTANLLFRSSFDISIEHSDTSIQSYTIGTEQKLIGMSPTTYYITGKVLD